MDWLRIGLIVVGILILAGVAWWARKRQAPRDERDSSAAVRGEMRAGGEPSLDLSDLDGLSATSGPVNRSDQRAVEPPPPHPPMETEEKWIVLHVAAPAERPFLGPDVLYAMQDAGIVYGDMRIFHRRVKGYRQSLFSVANMVEPGVFNPPAMDDFTTPGLTLFMCLPGPLTGPEALDQLVKTARYLATTLGGDLLDSHHQPMVKASFSRLRDDVVQHHKRSQGKGKR